MNKIFNTRTGRNREQTIRAYSLFLTIYRQELDMGNKPSAKKLSERLKIGKISATELPSDIDTAPYEVVTSLEYAEKWLNEILRPLRKQRKQNTQKKKSTIEADEQLGGIFEHEMEMPQMSAADILAEIERMTNTFFADMNKEIEKIKALNNNQ